MSEANREISPTANREIDATALAWIGAIGTVIVVALVFALEAFYLHTQDRIDADRVDRSAEFRSVRAENETKLVGYGYVDREKGVARIPVEEAMRAVATAAAAAAPEPASNAPSEAVEPAPSTSAPPEGAGTPSPAVPPPGNQAPEASRAAPTAQPKAAEPPAEGAPTP